MLKMAVWDFSRLALVWFAGFGLGLYWGAPENKMFFALLSLSVAFLAGVFVEPIRHHFWLQQEKWRLRWRNYSAATIGVEEAAREMRETVRSYELGLQTQPKDQERIQRTVARASRKVRRARSQAALLGERWEKLFEEFENTIKPQADEMRDVGKEWLRRRGEYEPQLAFVKWRVDRLNAEIEQLIHAEKDASQKIKEHGDLVTEQKALLDRQGRAFEEVVWPAMKKHSEVFGHESVGFQNLGTPLA